MKNLRTSILFSFCLLTFCSCADKNESSYNGQNSLFVIDSLVFPSDAIDLPSVKIDTINKMAKEIKRLDSLQNGVCDTCVTAYKSVIVENRLVAKELSDQTADLRKQLETISKLNQKAKELIENHNNGVYSYSQSDN